MRLNADQIGLGLALRKLRVSGTFLQAPAHAEDETNALFVLFGYGMGLRVVDLRNNRGDGGQNEIGPELFGDIAVLRTFAFGTPDRQRRAILHARDRPWLLVRPGGSHRQMGPEGGH